jgi:hypothetical protein
MADHSEQKAKKLTKEQQRAVLRVFKRSPDGAKSYLEFRRRVQFYHDLILLEWRGLLLGIEHDGHTHS